MSHLHLKHLFLYAAGAAVLASRLMAQVVPLTQVLTVNIVELQNPLGSNISVATSYSSELALYQQATQRVYAQAGVRIVWNSPTVYTDTGLANGSGGATKIYNVTDATTAGNLKQDYATSLGAGYNLSQEYLFFTGDSGSVEGVDEQSKNFAYGIYSTPNISNFSTVSESVFHGIYTALDVIAHELGHSLGLTHYIAGTSTSVGATNYYYNSDNSILANRVGANNVMYYSNAGVTTIGQITSDGTTGLSLLDANQKALLLLSPLLTADSGYQFNYSTNTVSPIPEPSTFALGSGLMVGLCALVRKRKRNKPAIAE